jgi:transposase
LPCLTSGQPAAPRGDSLLATCPVSGVHLNVFADGGYAGDKLKSELEKVRDWEIEIVKRSDAAKGFVLLPRRWVVERTIAWLNRNRRLAKDVEASIESALAWLYIASVKLMSRRLARA